MPNPSIPKGFKIVTSGFGTDGPGGVKRTEVGGGRPRYGLDYDRGTQRYNVSIGMTAQRYSVWTVFFHHIIKKGAITFDMEIDSGFGLQVHACNIMPGTYSAERVGGSVTLVRFAVEAESRVYDLSASEAQAYIDLWNMEGDDLIQLLSRLAIFANVDTNVLDFD
ncbi:hypothetical protein J2W32_000323 [Variovorax boronicumulans]|uniref:Uncharacterized protein n=1 Tax=Variovorax boronicumulans TaxID=436515 RepID=A0AAW8CTP6_9BURK|nr:hypothetical protein [Variovorax boronicumulans]MDP9891226.1 hypothetical protein [Variovorax boronicumulans]MDQ0051294.1 hypothetical protein [Variovorax boronicumulans]